MTKAVNRLIEAIAEDGGALAPLVERLKAEQARKVELEAQLATAQQLVASINVGEIRRKLEDRLTEWRDS